MPFQISEVDVWAGELENRPGALASKLAHIMQVAGASLEFVIARPAHDKPGAGVLFVAPLDDERQARIAEEVGLHKTRSIHALRLTGPDHPGLAAGIAGTLSAASINVTGMTAAAVDGRAVIYIRFATPDDAAHAAAILKPVLCGGKAAASRGT